MIIPSFLIARFGEKVAGRITGAAAVVLLIGLALLLAYCAGQRDEEEANTIELQEREIEILKDMTNAADNAADTRAADTARIALEQKELEDALKTEADPDKRRALRGCIIMRQQGLDTAHLPACSRPAPPR